MRDPTLVAGAVAAFGLPFTTFAGTLPPTFAT